MQKNVYKMTTAEINNELILVRNSIRDWETDPTSYANEEFRALLRREDALQYELKRRCDCSQWTLDSNDCCVNCGKKY